MRKFYSKEIPESPVIVNGISMRFDIIETEDPVLIRELDKCIAASVGGVMSITAEQFAEGVKKKASGIPSEDSLRHKQQRQELTSIPLDALRAAGVGSAKGQFASPQLPITERAHTPNNRPGIPGGRGPSPSATPEPIEAPSADAFSAAFSKPPTASMKDMRQAVG